MLSRKECCFAAGSRNEWRLSKAAQQDRFQKSVTVERARIDARGSGCLKAESSEDRGERIEDGGRDGVRGIQGYVAAHSRRLPNTGLDSETPEGRRAMTLDRQ